MPLPPIPGADWLRFRADSWRKQQQAQLDQLREQASAWDLEAQRAVHGIGDTFSSIGSGVQQGVQGAREAIQEVAPPPPPPLPIQDWSQQAQGAVDAIGTLGGTIGQAISQPDAQWNPLAGAAAAFPDDPNAGAKFAAQSVGRGINAAQGQSQSAVDAMLGFGPQGANLAAQGLGAFEVATTPYTAPGRATSAAAANMGASPETAAVLGGVAGAVGPGGTLGSIESGLAANAPSALRFAAPALGAIGAAAGIGTGLRSGAPAEEVLTRGFEGANVGAGVGEAAAHVLPQVPGIARGVADYAGRFGEAAQSLYDSELGTLGARRGQRGVRVPPLSPEQTAQRAADGAAEQRIFDAIQRLWRQGPEGEALADDLRFAAVGKGEEGEAAARALLAERGLDDLLPSGVVPEATAAGDGLLGAATRATDPFLARGALTGGERAFDLAAGTAGGVLGAATADEDATWQERAGRGVLGASLGALAGANARQLGRVGTRALDASGVLARNAPEIEGRALGEFGRTRDLAEAGYLQRDGSLLDLSGKREGGTPGMRSYDHRQVGSLLDEPLPEGGTAQMHRFMEDTGAVRIDGQGDYLTVQIPGGLSPAQRTTLLSRARDFQGAVVEVTDASGREVLHTLEVDFPSGRRQFNQLIQSLPEHVAPEAPTSGGDGFGIVSGRVPSARGNAADSAADRVNLRARRADAAARAQAVLDQTTPATRPGLGALGPAERDALRRATAAGREVPPEVQRRLDAAARTLAGPKPTDPAGANGWEKALAFMTSNLLSNPRSLLGNAMGGLEQAAGRAAGYVTEGRPGDVWTELKAAWAAKGDALAGALHQGLTGERPEAVRTALQEATDAAQHPEAFPGKAGLLATPALRVAGATDALFAMGARAGAEAVADARGLTGAKRAAFIKGQTSQAVLSAPASPIAKTISEGRQLLTAPDSSLPDRLKGAAMFASIPVVRIPQTIWEQGVKRAISPVTGLPTAAVQAATGDTAAAGKTLKNWAVNSTIGGVIAWQVGDGNITGSGPQDPNERRRWEAQGWRPTSVRVGGNWYSYDWLGPLGLQMNLTATFAETLAAEKRVPTKSELDRYTAAVGRVGATAIDEHYLSNFFKMAHSIGQGDLPDVAAKNVEELGARLVPYAGALNWAAKGADAVVREPQGPLEEVQARIPGLRGGVPARIDPTTGKPQRAGGTTLERLGGFGRITAETTPAAREVARLQTAKQDVSVRAFSPKEKYRDVEQTREQRRLLQTAYGEETAKATREVFDPKTPVGKAYAKADDAEKARILRSRLEHAAVLADITAGAKVARTPKGLADYEYAAVPHYDGVGGTADAIRRGNEAVRDAKAQLSAYKKKYPEDGEDRFERDFPKLYELSQLEAADADELKERRAAIDKRHKVTR